MQNDHHAKPWRDGGRFRRSSNDTDSGSVPPLRSGTTQNASRPPAKARYQYRSSDTDTHTLRPPAEPSKNPRAKAVRSSVSGPIQSRPATGRAGPDQPRGLSKGRDSPELRPSLQLSRYGSEYATTTLRRASVDAAGVAPAVPARPRRVSKDLPQIPPMLQRRRSTNSSSNASGVGEREAAATPSSEVAKEMRKSLPIGLLESRQARRSSFTSEAGGRPLTSTRLRRSSNPSVPFRRSNSDKSRRDSDNAEAEAQLQEGPNPVSPQKEAEKGLGDAAQEDEDFALPDEHLKPAGSFDGSGSAGAGSSIVRCAAVTRGGRHRGAWKKENQDQFIMQAGKPADKWAAMGVFDGHGSNGHLVSSTVSTLFSKQLDGSGQNCILDRSKHLPPGITEIVKSMFYEVTSGLGLKTNVINMMVSGSCALLCLVADNVIVTGWLGDSRAVLGSCWNASTKLWIAKALSKDHKPEDPKERRRILSNNGRVDRMVIDSRGTKAGPYRVYLRYDHGPGLAVSRAFGDLLGQEAGVICEPDVNLHTIDPLRDMFIVLASDGVWEVMTDQEVVQMVGDHLLDQKDPLREDVAAQASERVAKAAKKRWYVQHGASACDDITVITVLLCQPMSSRLGSPANTTATKPVASSE